MPRTGHMVCSIGGAFDQTTNAASYFHAVETVQVRNVPPAQASPGTNKPLTMRVCATWLREADDTPQRRYQAQLVGLFPGLPGEVVLAEFGAFSFETAVHRLFVPELTIPGFFGPGVLVIECRLRHADSVEWQSRQQFPIYLEM